MHRTGLPPGFTDCRSNEQAAARFQDAGRPGFTACFTARALSQQTTEESLGFIFDKSRNAKPGWG